MNVDISVEYRNIFVVVLFHCWCEIYRLGDFIRKLADQLVLLLDPIKNKNVNKLSKFEANFKNWGPIEMTRSSHKKKKLEIRLPRK